MKKLLIGTTALAAVAMMTAPGAQAAEKISLGLGGFSNVYVGSASNSDVVSDGTRTTANGFHNIDVKSNSEVYFTGSTTLDNGLTVKAHIQLETDRQDTATDPATTDRNWISIGSDSIGTVSLGSEAGAGNWASVTPPDATAQGVNDGDFTQWVAQPGAVDTSNRTNVGAADFHGVRYVSPSFGGVQVGLSLMPEANGNDQIAKSAAAAKNWQAGISYSGEFSGVGVDAGIGYLKRKNLGATAASGVTGGGKEVSYGLSVSFSGISVGASYGTQKTKNTAAGATRDASNKNWALGATYETGPYTVGLTYLSAKHTTGVVAGTAAPANKDKTTVWGLGVGYNMGPGVDANLSYYKVNYKDGVAPAVTADNNKGSAIVAGLLLSF